MTTTQLIARDSYHQSQYFGEWVGWSIVGILMFVLIVKAIKENKWKT